MNVAPLSASPPERIAGDLVRCQPCSPITRLWPALRRRRKERDEFWVRRWRHCEGHRALQQAPTRLCRRAAPIPRDQIRVGIRIQ